MKIEFLKPRFAGPRFDEHTLPVEVARDLAAYEELIIEVAKHLYIREHQGRQRVPKGFEKEFSLHLERVDEGSAKPLLSMVAAAGALIPGGGYGQYFEKSRDIIAQCIQAVSNDQPLPEAFPRHLLEHFNVLGRSLREGESVDLGPEGGSPAVLDPTQRKKLVLAAQKTYLREIELSGSVTELDWDKQTFRLRLDEGPPVVAPFSSSIDSLLREAAGVSRTRVTVRGVGVFDAYDKLQKISTIDHLEVIQNHALAAQFETLANMTDGWMEGAGKAPPRDDVEWLADQLVVSFPNDLPYPFACPIPTGGVFLEWSQGEWIISAEFPLPERRCELQATNTSSSETFDEEISLNDIADFSEVYEFVRRFV